MEPKTTKKPSRKLVVFKRELPFYLMLIPGVTFLIIFSYLPMFGLVMAFQDFTPLRSFKNSPWVGLKNFRDMLALPTFWNVVGNTLSISIAKIILRLLVPLILALLLNEVVHHKFMWSGREMKRMLCTCTIPCQMGLPMRTKRCEKRL